MSDPRDYKLEIASLDAPAGNARTDADALSSARPFVSVRFACCNVYQRIYRNSDGTRYEGRCPRCARSVRFVVGPGGTDARIFVVE